jgi:DNA-directed RNA polymerase subunit F
MGNAIEYVSMKRRYFPVFIENLNSEVYWRIVKISAQSNKNLRNVLETQKGNIQKDDYWKEINSQWRIIREVLK